MATKKANEIDQKYKDGYVKFKLMNIPIRYVHLVERDTAFGNDKWCFEALVDDNTAKELENMGYVLKEKEEKDGTVTKNIFKPKKEHFTRGGKENDAPMVVSRDGKTPITSEPGNGSVANMILTAKAWKVKGKWTLSAYIESVQIVKMEEKSTAFDNLDTNEDDVPF